VSQQSEASEPQSVERLSPATNDYVEVLYHWQRYLTAGHLAGGKHVLDVACGEGYGADYLARFAERVCGVDIDAQAVKQARARYRRKNLFFEQGSAEKLPFADAAFDMATSFETIEHLPPGKQEPFLEEVLRILKPGGFLLISTPNKQRTEKFPEKNPYHLKEFYLDEFTSLLGRRFKHVDCWFQEINLATFSWSPAGQFPKQSAWNTIGWNEGLYAPSEGPISDFLYVIALCSNEPTSVDLNSVCFDVTRRPLESLWSDYLSQIDRLKRVNQDLEAHVKRVETALAVSRFEHRTMATEKDASIAMLQGELAGIHASRSWKLVQGYQHMMDRSVVGRVLRPIRNRILKRPVLTDR